MVVEAVPEVLQKPPVPGSDGGDSEYESADEEELGEEEEEEEDELIILPDGIAVPGEDNRQLDDDEDRKNPQYIPKKGTFYEHDDRTAAEEDAEKVPEEPAVKKEVGKKKVWKEDDKWNHDKFNEFDQAPKSREELIAVYGYDIRNEEGPPRARRRRRYGRGPNKYTRNWEDLDAYAKPVRGGTARGGPGRGGTKSWQGSRKMLENDEEFPALGMPIKHQRQPDDGKGERDKSDHQALLQEVQRTLQDSVIIADKESHKELPQHTPPHQHHKNYVNSPQPQDNHVDSFSGRRGGKSNRSRGRGFGRGQNRDQHRYNEDRGNYPDSRPNVRGNRGGFQQRTPQPHPSHGQRDVDEITAELKNINITSQNREEPHRAKSNRGGGNPDNRRNVPPRLQESAAAVANSHNRVNNKGGNASPGADGSGSSRPKRYSSQRQRSIPDQPVPPFPQQQGYIDPAIESGYQGGVYDGGSGNPSSGHAVTAPISQLPLAGGDPSSFVPPAFTSPPTFPPEPFLGRPPAPRMFPPVTQSPHLFAPVAAPVAGPPPGPPPLGAPPVGAPPVTGPPFLPPENMINYGAHPGPHPGTHPGPLPGGAPLAGPHPPQFPPFQGYTPGPVSQPGEIYSNGVTYYNTESQQHIPRSNLPLQKRPKAAIPIVPPPERESRRDGGPYQEIDAAEQDSLCSSTGYENAMEDYPVEQSQSDVIDVSQHEEDLNLSKQESPPPNEPSVPDSSSHTTNTDSECHSISQEDLPSQKDNTQAETISHTENTSDDSSVIPNESTVTTEAEQNSTVAETLHTEQTPPNNEASPPPQVSQAVETAVAAS